MKNNFDPKENYNSTKEAIGYVNRKNANQDTYNRIGFMSGLEVHQQLDTKEKLFCHCPAGVFNKSEVYDAELIRHMRPTLSELGEYDGTALMEFKTKKEIIYKIKHETCCTYEVDDTPPFPLNNEALEKAIEISLLSKLNIVGEVHITRKQYLDGSIPTGFQRTAIIGVEGEIALKNKKINLIQLSLEEDSCREISDIGHTRVYKTDRLGMPLIETVTYPEMINPDEVMEACNVIRFLGRSTDKVRVGIGAGRQDVNVSCKGGTRVEIKGVAHTKWIPNLTHIECFRQWTLLAIREKLNKTISKTEDWKINSKELSIEQIKKYGLQNVIENNYVAHLVNLSGFQGILSHFTQPGKIFVNEISDRLKVIACIEKPNITHSEAFEPLLSISSWNELKKLVSANDEDAQIIVWGPEKDIPMALETIEERCNMAFNGVPEETRKSFEDGTTIFERVLPGADRMYPDTDSAPIPVNEEYTDSLRENIPSTYIERYHELKKWNIPEDTYTYIFRNNLYPIIKKIIIDLEINPVFIGTFFGHRMKFTEGQYTKGKEFKYEQVYDLFKYLKENDIEIEISKYLITEIYQHPKMDFKSLLSTIKFNKQNDKEILSKISFLKKKFSDTRVCKSNIEINEKDWVMGELRKSAVGNIKLNELCSEVINK